MNALAEVPVSHPMRAEWESYKITFEYSQTRAWAMSEAQVDASLWKTFTEGWQRAVVATTTALHSTHAAADKVAEAVVGSPAGPCLPEVIYDTMRVQRHMKHRGYNVDMGTVSKILDAVVQLYDADKAKARD